MKEKLSKMLENCPHLDILDGLSYWDDAAEYLIANGVTFAPAIPGPELADPNIMELCFHNGERHMKEKICMELTRIAEYMPYITVAQAIAMLEGPVMAKLFRDIGLVRILEEN